MIYRLRLSWAALLLVLALGAFSGCKNSNATKAVRKMNRDAERSGSPYRYRAFRVEGGTAVSKYRVVPPTSKPIPEDLQPTSASVELQKDVLGQIALLQRAWGCSLPPELLGTKSLPGVPGSVKESWFVKQDTGAIRFDVTMAPGNKGGTDFQVAGPVE